MMTIGSLVCRPNNKTTTTTIHTGPAKEKTKHFHSLSLEKFDLGQTKDCLVFGHTHTPYTCW